MAATTVEHMPSTPTHGHNGGYVFDADPDPGSQSYQHRFSRFDIEPLELGATASPSQAKRTIEAHLQETDRRLLDAQKLGNSLLKQREDLTSRLEEVEQLQDEAQIPADLRKRLADIEREHADVGKEVARALIGPKQKQDDAQLSDSGVFSSQATGSPTKVTAPSRRHRNQPSTRAGDLQFAADISTSLLAQVRQLQAAVAERDDTIKRFQAEREASDQDVLNYVQKIRALDESEQRYKDENWSLETQNHELSNTAKELHDKEKKLTASLGAVLAEKSRLQNDLDELILAHGKLTEEHTAARKAHDTEIHGLKRNVDVADTERQSLQDRIDELVSQNQELAKAVASRFRTKPVDQEGEVMDLHEETARAFDSADESPPPSPTKATPRHGGLESETLRSSLHHAHRMIQNLKGNIHREKTEKIELKRLLQEARDELEQRRGGDTSAAKRQKTKPDAFKKPARPDMLGGSRRARTDVELTDDDWEDQNVDTPSQTRFVNMLQPPDHNQQPLSDLSDAYHTANDTEGTFDTADERNTTESEAFMTGAESLAGDSTDELTETEDNASRTRRIAPGRVARESRVISTPGNRNSFVSTASASADELEDMQTPMQPSFTKFKLRNRTSYNQQATLPQDDTPESFRGRSLSQDSPATITAGQSPKIGEQTLFAELEGMGEFNSDTHSTPARSTLSSQHSTPAIPFTPSRSGVAVPFSVPRPVMVDSSTMTESWAVEPALASQGHNLEETPSETSKPVAADENARILLPAAELPLPPSVPASPIRKIDNSTQYTPQRGTAESPIRPGSSYITPPKTVWDEVHEPNTSTQSSAPVEVESGPIHQLGFSSVLFQGSEPILEPTMAVTKPTANLTFSPVLSQDMQPMSPTSVPEVTNIPRGLETPERGSTEERPQTAEKIVGGGLLASAAAVLGFSVGKHDEIPGTTEDNIGEPVESRPEMVDTATSPLKNISGNARRVQLDDDDLTSGILKATSSNDQSSQTMLTAEQLDEALKPRELTLANVPVIAPETGPIRRAPSSPSRYSARPTSRTREFAPIIEDPPITMPSSPPQRPSSASSTRTSSLVSQQHPPLPSDHKDAIAKANNQIGSPTKRENAALKAGGIMGPPIMPASAMRRPRTPNSSVRTPMGDSRAAGKRGTLSSQVSRRSSVSSFASELDERFNIRPDQQAASHGFEAGPGTDPRMIQAITQTMIGEFLWKYTRRAGSKEMSTTRHRRYFWVHPYTKTLYWSDQDPQTAGRSELKAKSVAIESVRVVSDDNPMPPGLHRKSLEVTTPGRIVKFTASTGQRHETWFNALSYLLHRSEPMEPTGTYAPNGNDITRDDLAEFSVNGYGARLVPNDNRMSMSSYNSRTTTGTGSNRVARQSLPVGIGSSNSQIGHGKGVQSSLTQGNSDTVRRSRADQPQVPDKDRTIRASSVSRISKMFGSVTGRTRSEAGQATPQNRSTAGESSIYDASVVSDGRKEEEEEEEARRRQEQYSNPGLEDVRACCDGE
ncbi:hypothetical protein H2198_010621 [Neophaeococcomyces mojaviensis]|uniref:Uncharacterized protein n=1 Tax=Neophaeococcomyces mojaviensis TaxID=3383035 RepID=A0ACC2ZR21_9EURO|nr:hypothetical protein H2198_010621 [Knufia sp. JES_112]